MGIIPRTQLNRNLPSPDFDPINAPAQYGPPVWIPRIWWPVPDPYDEFLKLAGIANDDHPHLPMINPVRGQGADLVCITNAKTVFRIGRCALHDYSFLSAACAAAVAAQMAAIQCTSYTAIGQSPPMTAA